MKDIEKLVEFMRFTDKFRAVERVVFSKDHPRQESDSEHAFQLALCAWYIIETKKLPLDRDKVFRYALAHDLVEVYAGDTYFYTEDRKERDTKKEREEAAAERIREEFPEFDELHDAIRSYEEKADAESRFVYALDKVLPSINIYLDEGKTWRERAITLDMLTANKTPKVAVSPEVMPYFNELVEILKREEGGLFHPGSASS